MGGRNTSRRHKNSVSCGMAAMNNVCVTDVARIWRSFPLAGRDVWSSIPKPRILANLVSAVHAASFYLCPDSLRACLAKTASFLQVGPCRSGTYAYAKNIHEQRFVSFAAGKQCRVCREGLVYEARILPPRNPVLCERQFQAACPSR